MKTLVLGASPLPYRFSNRATLMLLHSGHDVIPVGRRMGTIGGVQILDILQKPFVEDVHTITLYMNPRNQEPWYHYILGLAPRRLIFNPGAENQHLTQLAVSQGIITLDACTLVMLSADTF